MMAVTVRAQSMLVALSVFFIPLLHPLDGSAQGTAFLYQGQLSDSGVPANGSYDMAFALYATNTDGIAVAGPLTNCAVAVSNGLFTATLDFGVGAFNGESCWLDISVTPAGSNSFVELMPRQPILTVPYAIMASSASSASNLSGTVSAAQLEGTLPLGQLPAAVVTNGSSGVTLAGSFRGDGSGLTNVNQTTFGTSSIGSTNLFYGLFFYFSSINNSSPMGMDYIASSSYANTNWNLIEPNPVYIDPDFMLTNANGPTIQTGGGVTEASGVLYTVYCRYGGAGEPSQLAIASSTDMTNWTMIATWSANDPFTNTFYDSPNWSQVNYGGTNWIIFDYCTNQPGATAGVVQALPVSLSPKGAVFGSPISITTNGIGSGIAGNCYTILTNNAGLFILPCCQSVGVAFHPRCSANFLGPYTNLTAWTVHGADSDYTPWLLSVSNNAAWYWWDNGNISVSSDYGTNWATLSSQPLYLLNPAFQGSAGGWGIASKPEGIFWLNSPLEDQSASMVQGSDANFTGTVSANNFDAQTVHAANGIFNNLSVAGIVQGTAMRPFTVNNLDWGTDVTNNGWFNFVGGQNISIGQDSLGGVFLGAGYSSDDGAGGAVFEFEDGNDVVNSPNGGPFGSEEGLFYVNAQQIIFDQGPVNSKAGYEANGTPGATQDVDVQTNADGPHGLTFKYQNGLFIGVTPY